MYSLDTGSVERGDGSSSSRVAFTDNASERVSTIAGHPSAGMGISRNVVAFS